MALRSNYRSAAVARKQLRNKAMDISMARLSSGKRINSAADDSAGLAIASRLTSEARGLDMASRNAADVINAEYYRKRT